MGSPVTAGDETSARLMKGRRQWLTDKLMVDGSCSNQRRPEAEIIKHVNI